MRHHLITTASVPQKTVPTTSLCQCDGLRPLHLLGQDQQVLVGSPFSCQPVYVFNPLAVHVG